MKKLTITTLLLACFALTSYSQHTNRKKQGKHKSNTQQSNLAVSDEGTPSSKKAKPASTTRTAAPKNTGTPSSIAVTDEGIPSKAGKTPK